MDFVKDLILIISYQVMYILFANKSNGPVSVRAISPNSIPIIPVKKVESSTIIDNIIFWIICCVLLGSFLLFLLKEKIIIAENDESIISDSSLKNPVKENTI